MDTKKNSKFDENDNIYKNTIDLDDAEENEDTETIEIDDVSDQPEKKKFEEKYSAEKKPEKKEFKPVRRPITPVRPVIKKRQLRIQNPRKERRSVERKEKSPMWPWIVLIIVVVLGAAILLWSVFFNKQTPSQTNEKTVATVNGESITLQDIDRRLAALNPVYRQLFTKELILNQSIDELLLVQDANSKGITVSDAELTALFDSLLAQNNMTYAELNTKLEAQGLTLDYFKDIYRKKLTIDKLLNESLANVQVTDKEIQEYYNNNTKIFREPDTVTVKHLLISTDNRTDAEAKTLIETIRADYLDNDADFCDLVTKYTDDAGSKENCGEYTFAKGQMVPQFEDLSFQLKPDETGIVKTQFGYHFILKLKDIPGKQATLEELSDKIKQSLEYQKQQDAYDQFIKSLRAKATVNIDYAVLNANETQQAATGNVVQQPEQTQPEQPAVKPADQPEAKPQETKPATDAASVVSCLNDNNAVLYGTYWKKDVKDQKALFGDAVSKLAYVECDPNGPNSDPSACEKKGITSYPTWIIGGKTFVGIKTLEELNSLAGC